MIHRCWMVACALVLAAEAAVPASSPARLAYIDPGAGSFILQALVATLAGVAVAVYSYWNKIKNLLGLSTGDQDEREDGPAER